MTANHRMLGKGLILVPPLIPDFHRPTYSTWLLKPLTFPVTITGINTIRSDSLTASRGQVKSMTPSAGDIGDVGSIPGSGRAPGGGHNNPLQCSCLQNPMDRGAWWATVHKVTKSRTRRKRLSSSKQFHRICSGATSPPIYWKLLERRA